MERIVFDKETKALLTELKNANGYLECEDIILNNLKKHDKKNVSIMAIENYLKKLLKYIEDKSVINRGNAKCENYVYAAGFLRSILETPNRDSWIKK